MHIQLLFLRHEDCCTDFMVLQFATAGDCMKKLTILFLGVFAVISGQAKTLILSSQQWRELDKSNSNILQKIDVKNSQKIQVDIDELGEIINLSIFNEDVMNEAKVDGHLE